MMSLYAAATAGALCVDCGLRLVSTRSRSLSSPTSQLLTRHLGEAGYAGVEIRNAPSRTEIVIRATRPQDVLGEKGRNIRELTMVVQNR
jgi:hypothetical protein